MLSWATHLMGMGMDKFILSFSVWVRVWVGLKYPIWVQNGYEQEGIFLAAKFKNLSTRHTHYSVRFAQTPVTGFVNLNAANVAPILLIPKREDRKLCKLHYHL